MSSDNTGPKSFIINDDTFNDDKQTIITDLYTAIIYLHMFTKTKMNGGYIKTPYFMPSATMRPNAIYSVNAETKNYKCVNMYIFKATHNITMDAKYQGELVVELVPTVNTSEKLYLCFLLSNVRYMDREPNDVDNLISISIKPPVHYDTMNFNLQKIIDPNGKKIIYKSGIDTIVIFLTPITINEIDFSEYAEITYGMFAMYPVNDQYKIISSSKKEGFQEGIDTDTTNALNDLFNSNLVTCTPVDDNNDSLVKDNTVTYLAKGGSSNSPQNAIGIAFITIIVAIGSSLIGAPLFFKYAITNALENSPPSITLLSIITCVMLVVLGLVLIILGNKYDPSEMWVGMFIMIFTSLSILSVATNRAFTEKPEGEFATLTETMQAVGPNIMMFAGGIWYYNGTVDMVNIGVLLGIIAIVVIVLIIVSEEVIKKDKKMLAKEENIPGYIDHVKNLLLGVGIPYSIIFTIWILMLIKHSK